MKRGRWQPDLFKDYLAIKEECIKEYWNMDPSTVEDYVHTVLAKLGGIPTKFVINFSGMPMVIMGGWKPELVPKPKEVIKREMEAYFALYERR